MRIPCMEIAMPERREELIIRLRAVAKGEVQDCTKGFWFERVTKDGHTVADVTGWNTLEDCFRGWRYFSGHASYPVYDPYNGLSPGAQYELRWDKYEDYYGYLHTHLVEYIIKQLDRYKELPEDPHYSVEATRRRNQFLKAIGG